MGKDIKMFAGANTPDGFVGFYKELVDMYDLKKLYILKGGSGIGKSTFITKFADAFPNHEKLFLVCSGDPKSLDGVIIPHIGIGIIDGTDPHIVDPIYPGVVDEIINLGEYIIWERVKATRETLQTLTAEKKSYYKTAFKYLARARDTHHKIEKLYEDAVDFDAVQSELDKIIMKHADNNN